MMTNHYFWNLVLTEIESFTNREDLHGTCCGYIYGLDRQYKAKKEAWTRQMCYLTKTTIILYSIVESDLNFIR